MGNVVKIYVRVSLINKKKKKHPLKFYIWFLPSLFSCGQGIATGALTGIITITLDALEVNEGLAHNLSGHHLNPLDCMLAVSDFQPLEVNIFESSKGNMPDT